MEPFTVRRAAEVLGARIIGSGEGEITAVCNDTRQGAQGALFFALKGEKADGHQYVAQAFEKGAVAAIVEHEVPGAKGTQLVVPDALAALGDLARWYRGRFDTPVIGVTGSVGKTSTREMIACALRAWMSVHTNEHNFNNEIGVPLTLFGMTPEHEVVVLEMAMRGRRQIARLAEIAQPNLGVITNIGLSHVELLGSRDEIAAAKGELLEALPPDGTAILNADDDYFTHLSALCHCKVVTYGVKHPANFHATHVAFTAAGEPRFRINGKPVALRSPGVHQVTNAAAACAVADALGVPLDDAIAKLEEFVSPAMRMETVEAPNGITVLNDSYNAAPDSMRAALETLAVLGDGKRRTVAVLGDMKELGAQTEMAHRYVGETAAKLGVGLLVAVGEASTETAAAAAHITGEERVRRFESTESAVDGIGKLLQPGDVVLVKGSRAMAMERIVQALTEGRA